MNNNNSVNIDISGDDADYSLLEILAPEHDVRATRLDLILNSQEARGAQLLRLAAETYSKLARLVSSCLQKQNKRLEIQHPDGTIVIENYSVEEIERLFKRGGYFFIRTMSNEQSTRGNEDSK